jgi:hypothetical protein
MTLSPKPYSSPSESHFAWTFLPILLTILCSGVELSGQDNPNVPKLLRFDVTPLVGYRSSITFPTTQLVQGQPTNAVLSQKPSYGFAVGVRLNEEDLIEVRWARQASDIRFDNNNPVSTSVALHQVHLDCTHEFIMDTWPMWIRPYVIGSVGGTHIVGGTNSALTGFSFGLGTGLKVYVSRHVGLRFQVEWLPIVTNTELGAFVCGRGCVVHLSATAASQGEVAVGPVFRF